MAENEYPFLEKPEKLEYHNETWAAQDIRKCNVLLFASKYDDSRLTQLFTEKAEYIFSRKRLNICMSLKQKIWPTNCVDVVKRLYDWMQDCFNERHWKFDWYRCFQIQKAF